MKYVALTLFALTMPLANYLIGSFGTECIPDGPCLVPVGFGFMAPSGVLVVGLALVLRDWLQELTNWKWSAFAVLVGGVLSWITSDPFLAMASAAAFVTAEIFDLAVYTPLRKHSKSLAVFASGLVGALVDSMIFVYVAFGSLEFSLGTTLGKIYASVAVAAALYFYHKKGKTYA